MPVEKSTPRRSEGSSGEPASANASLAATSANWLEGSSRFATGWLVRIREFSDDWALPTPSSIRVIYR